MTLISDSLRRIVVERAASRCEYCGLSQETQVATFPVDHLLPVSEDGPTELNNLALTCPRCNALKWVHTEAEDPTTGDRVGIFNPRVHVWAEHFRWLPRDPTFLEPLTSVGRATVGLLKLNSQQRRDIRQWLTRLQMHPPS